MNSIKKRVLSTIATLAIAFGNVATPAPVLAEENMINVLSADNAEFTIVTSGGTTEGKDALDRDIISKTTTGDYDGIPIFDVNGNDGDDYIILMTVTTTVSVPMERVKLNYEFGMPFADGTFNTNGGTMYMNKPTIPWPEGLEIYVSDTGKNDSWQKVYSCESLEGKLLEEKRPEELWDQTGGIRTYYDLPLDKPVQAKYLRIAIRDVKPWLGAMNIPEIEIQAKTSDISKNFHKININTPGCAKVDVSGNETIGKEYGMEGAETTLTVKPDEVSQINSVKLDGVVLEGDNGVYKFTMPDKDVTIDVDSGISVNENVPLEVTSCSVDGGNILPKGTVPVITFNFNKKIGWLDKNMILVNGKENTGLVQHAFADATDATKAYVVLFSDKLDASANYTVKIKDTLKSAAGMPLDGKAEVSFAIGADYHDEATSNGAGYIKGYEDGSFRPENNITLSEVLTIASRLADDKDYSVVKASDDAAKRIDLAKIIYIMKNGSVLESEEDMFTSLVKDGIFKGYEDGAYKRESNVTRAEAVALFNRSMGKIVDYSDDEEETTVAFPDVSSDYWAVKDIALASMGTNEKITWTENIPEVEFDVFNKANNIWTQVPCVSKKLRDMGVSGGEGGQWLQAIECDNVDGQLLFAGVDIAAMVRSTDGGKTWQRSNRGFMAAGCVDIEIDPNNKNKVLAIGSCSNAPLTGIYLSEDMGYSWRQVHSYIFNGQRDTREQLAWDKSSYDKEIGGSRIAYWSNMYRIEAANEGFGQTVPKRKSDRKGGLFKTEDGGKTWFCVNEEMSDCAIKVNPKDGTVYAGNESGFFISTDGGVTFTNILSGEPIYGLDVVETRPDNVYINDHKGVLVSENCGRTFTRINGVGFPNKTDLSDVRNITRDLQVSPANPDYMLVDCRDYINYNNRRYFTHDGGRSWTECGYDKSKDFFFCHNRQHAFAWHPTDPNKVWSLGGDWITSSDNGGESFIWDANGYCGTPPGGRVNFNPYNTDLIFAGAQDLLGIFSKDRGYTWEAIEPESGGGFGCSYGSCALDDKTLVAAIADGWYTLRKLKVSHDGGKTWGGPNLPLKNGTARRATSFWVSPSDPNTVLAGEYVSHDRAQTWKEMVGCEMVMAVNYFHNKELWGLNKEVLVCSYDNGETWYPFSQVKLDDTKARDNVGSIYTTGAGVHTWDVEYDGINDILYYLPGNINCGVTVVRIENNVHTNIGNHLVAQEKTGDRYTHLLALDPRHPDVLYVGTYGTCTFKNEVAVQRSCDRGETFQVLSSAGDKASIVPDGPSAGTGAETIVIHPETGELWLWDGGEGMWKFPAPYTEK